MQPQDATIICPLNDAESFTILCIAKRLGYESRISVQNTWLCPLDREPPHTFINLKKTAVIIEMPGKEQEDLLRKHHDLLIIDHHDYSSLRLHRDHPESSLQQFAGLVGHALSRDEMAIAINDQRYIYGLAEAGYSRDEINRVRRLDLLLQGYTDEDFLVSEKDLRSEEKFKNGVTHYRSSLQEKFSCLLDLHVLENDCGRSDVVITGPADATKGKYIYFSGRIGIVERLKHLGGYSKRSAPQYGFWGGFESGIEKVDLAKAMDIIRK
ncbi:MAG TPA: hypothetical protein VI873_02565 [Candidatus Peribacteraceae bacterium]|nr:hypothetical protein [Candidatus Peribacteraceae bacterium]